MSVKVLVVDDSGFFRRRLTEILSSDINIKVVGTASNGREAIEQVLALKPDVITMDYEMPLMDGISAVRQIMQRCPTPVLMFSSLTHEGARVTLDALDAGAVDYLPKNFEDISLNPEKLRQLLCEKVKEVARSNRRFAGFLATPTPSALGSGAKPATSPSLPSSTSAPSKSWGSTLGTASSAVAPVRRTSTGASSNGSTGLSVRRKAYRLVAIGTSTGGPVALQHVLTKLPERFPTPIVLIQHMPATFTRAFAERLDKLCQIRVKEAEDGDTLQPGLALLAPGGKQMMLDSRGIVRILPGDERLNYKPSVDITFGSAARTFQDKVLAVVLTGMGADGREGARLLKENGSQVWTQDEASCVIYGMPMAVFKANLSDAVFSLDEIGPRLTEVCQ